MAVQPKATLKTYFEQWDKPTELQFVDLIDSTVNEDVDFSDYQAISEKWQADWYAELNASWTVPATQLPNRVASKITAATGNFNKNLSSDDDTAQKIFDKLDNMDLASGWTGWNEVLTPSISYPLNWATDYAFEEIIWSSYNSSSLFTWNVDYVEWELATDSGFTNVIESKSDSIETTWLPTQWSPLTTYYVRVRHWSSHHLSEWSDAIEFTTMDITIWAPVIESPLDGATGISTTPAISSSEYAMYWWSEDHESTDWQVSTVSDFSTIEYEALNSTDLINHLVWTPLGNEVEYYVRARYHSANYSSEWGNPISFTTIIFIENMVLLSAWWESFLYKIKQLNGKYVWVGAMYPDWNTYDHRAFIVELSDDLTVERYKCYTFWDTVGTIRDRFLDIVYNDVKDEYVVVWDGANNKMSAVARINAQDLSVVLAKYVDHENKTWNFAGIYNEDNSNYYVAGSAGLNTASWNKDIHVIKFNSNLSRLAEKHIDTWSTSDVAYCITKSANGYILIWAKYDWGADPLILSMNTSLNDYWSTQFGYESGIIDHIMIDSEDNIVGVWHIYKEVNNVTTYYALVVKMNPEGDSLTYTYMYWDTDKHDMCKGITQLSNWDYALVVYSENDTWVWWYDQQIIVIDKDSWDLSDNTVAFGSDENDYPEDIMLTDTGNIMMVGNVRDVENSLNKCSIISFAEDFSFSRWTMSNPQYSSKTISVSKQNAGTGSRSVTPTYTNADVLLTLTNIVEDDTIVVTQENISL